VALFPQSIGPFKKGFVKNMVSYVLNLCDLILPRDGLSLQVVQQLKIAPEKVYLVPDVAVNQPHVSSGEAKRLLEAERVNLNKRPLVGMAISKYSSIDHEAYFPVLRELCRFIVEDVNGAVALFAANRTFRKDIGDWELTRHLYESLYSHSNVILLSRAYTPRECKGMLGQMDLFISTRMHISILATMIGTPTITVNTQPKLRGYMELIHQGSRSCDVKDFTIEKAKELVRDSLAHNKQIRLSLEGVKNEMGKRAMMASELLRMVYNQKKKAMP
jgi:polysaccharide pyruvyl transferase WcaK-like protein